MNREKTKKIILSALFAAMCFIGTYIIQVPIPATGGYINLGDGFVLVSGWLLGPVYGSLAAGIGSALADLIAGYPIYIPATFLIKAFVALIAHYFFKFCSKIIKKYNIVSRIISSIIAEIAMIGGYFLYETVLYGVGGALGAVLGNSIQAVSAVIVAPILISAIEWNGALKKLVNKGM